MRPLWERCNGRWRSILIALGIDPRCLTGKQVPCPICGGRDRFRFDNKRGDGTWFCNQCRAGQGIKLAMLFTGTTDYKTIAEKIEAAIGRTPPDPVRTEPSEAAKRAAMNKLWCASNPVSPGDPVDLWMRHRGLGASSYPVCLRHVGLRYSGPPVTVHPGMLAMMSAPTSEPVMIHRTFLTPGGTKAPVDKVRMFCPGKVPPGGAVRLTPAASTMGVAEGIETSLAAIKLFGIPTWAALNDGGVEKFEPPTAVEHLVIFGDNDTNGVGQKAAYGLASRLAPMMHVEVRIPDLEGSDWNDVLLNAGR
jgi:putative DNA primase/helicase